MRALIVGIAGLSLVACASEPAPSGAAPASGRPVLHDVTPDGGRVSNANGEYAAEAAAIAVEHCRKSNQDMRVTGITAERMSLIFTCVPFK